MQRDDEDQLPSHIDAEHLERFTPDILKKHQHLINAEQISNTIKGQALPGVSWLTYKDHSHRKIGLAVEDHAETIRSSIHKDLKNHHIASGVPTLLSFSQPGKKITTDNPMLKFGKSYSHQYHGPLVNFRWNVLPEKSRKVKNTSIEQTALDIDAILRQNGAEGLTEAFGVIKDTGGRNTLFPHFVASTPDKQVVWIHQQTGKAKYTIESIIYAHGKQMDLVSFARSDSKTQRAFLLGLPLI